MPLVLGAAVADIFLVLALLLLAYAAVIVFQRPLVQLFSQVPVIGGQIVDAVIKVTQKVADTANDWAQKAADPLVQLVHLPQKVFGDWLAMQTAAFEDLGNLVIRWVGSVNDSLASLASRVTTALSRVAALADLVDTVRGRLADLASLVATLRSVTIPDAIAAARAYALSLVTGAVDRLESVVRNLIDSTRAAAAAALASAVATLNRSLDALRSWTAQAITTAVHPIEVELGQLGQAIGQAIDGVKARLGVLEGLLPLAALLPLVATLVQAIPRWLTKERDCWDPACDFLGDVTDGLGNVGQLLTGSALLALVAAAIADPEGTAETVHGMEDELRPLASLVTEALAGRSV